MLPLQFGAEKISSYHWFKYGNTLYAFKINNKSVVATQNDILKSIMRFRNNRFLSK